MNMPRHPSAAPLKQPLTRAARAAISLRLPGWVTVVAGWGLLWATAAAPAATVLVPGIPAAPPAVGFGNPLAALRVGVNGHAFAFSGAFPPATDSFTELNTEFADPGEYNTFVNVHKAVNVTSGDLLSSAVGAGNAGFGRLGASSTALTSIHLGSVDALARVTVEFIDVLELNPAGTDVVDLSSTWNVVGTTTAHPFGSAIALGQVWFFPFGPLPVPGAQFQANFYREWFQEGDATPKLTLLGFLNDLPPGSKYWIYGRLETYANRNQTGTSIADFSHTAQFLIEPAPGTPPNAYTTASGFDYQTVIPEPTTAAATAAAALLLAARRQRQ